MTDKQASELIAEIKKIRIVMDSIKTCMKTIAEQMKFFAVSDAPADSAEET